MRFLCLAYGAEQDWRALSEDRRNELLANDEAIRRRGALMAAVREPVVVRAHGGDPVASPGPFAAAPVPLAGFSVIEADDVDEVVRMVAGTPCAVAGGAVEIRPFWEDLGETR